MDNSRYLSGMDPAEVYFKQDGEKKGISQIGKVAGICAIAYTVLQNVIPLPITLIKPLYRIYISSLNYESILLIVLSIFTLLVPFGIGGMWLGKKTDREVFIFNKPKDPYLAVLAVSFGLFVCLAGNWIASMTTALSETLGFKLTSPDFAVPSDIPGRILYVVAIGIVPALAEETAFRGAILQPLRAYGDRFAIIMSSFVFAILHGNLIQAPFALLVGFALGYICCITESLWPCIALHCINNLYSVFTEFMLEDFTDEALLNKLYYGSFFALLTISIIGSLLFFFAKENNKIKVRFNYLPTNKRVLAFFLNIPMIIAILIMLKITSEFVTRI